MFKFKQSLTALFGLAILLALATLFAFAEERPGVGPVEDLSTQNARGKKTADSQFYMVFLEVVSGGPEACTPIPVPEGMRLVIETVAVGAVASNDTDVPEAEILSQLNRGGFLFGARLPIPMHNPQNSLAWRGHLRTHIASGPVTVGDGVASFFLCGRRAPTFSGYVVGHLLPL